MFDAVITETGLCRDSAILNDWHVVAYSTDLVAGQVYAEGGQTGATRLAANKQIVGVIGTAGSSAGTVGGSCGRSDMSVSLREGGAASSLLYQILHRHNRGSECPTEFATSTIVGLGPGPVKPGCGTKQACAVWHGCRTSV